MYFVFRSHFFEINIWLIIVNSLADLHGIRSIEYNILTFHVMFPYTPIWYYIHICSIPLSPQIWCHLILLDQIPRTGEFAYGGESNMLGREKVGPEMMMMTIWGDVILWDVVNLL